MKNKDVTNSDLSKTLVKITVLLFAGLLLCIGVCCAIGFTVGGAPDLPKQIAFFTVSLLFGILSAIFLKQDKSLSRVLILLITAIFFVAVCCGYTALNRLSSSEDYIEYQTEITDINYYGKSFCEEICFPDRSGNEAVVIRYNLGIYENDQVPEEGKTITVREKQGGFGYPVYKIINHKKKDVSI